MAPAAVIVKQRNGLSVYVNTPATDKFVSIESLASLLQSTVTILRPRIVAAPNTPITVLTVTPAVGAPVDIEFIPESKLPGLLSFIAKPPTSTGLTLASTQLLRLLARFQFSLVSFTENFSGTTGSLNVEAVEDQVAALIVAGSGITKVYDDGAGTLTLSATGNIKVLNSVFDLANEPAITNVVLTKQYWPEATDPGNPGVFTWVASSVEAVDGGRIFAGQGAPTNGRWVRGGLGTSVTPDDYGAIKVNAAYNRDLTFAAFGAIQLLLSSKFASLAAAQAWYPQANILALTESVNSAAFQQCHVRNLAMEIKAGSYWLNRSIEYMSVRSIVGSGIGKTYLLFAASAGAGFKPLAVDTPYSQGSETYKKNLKISQLSAWSDATKIDYATGNPTLLPTYDAAKSGFWSPPSSNGSSTEGSLGFPLLIDCVFSDLQFGRFAGNGCSIDNQFSCSIDGISGDENAGYAIEFYSNVGSQIKSCYVGRFNQLGGFNLPYGGSLQFCNGVDTLTKDIPWGVVGTPSSVQKVVATFYRCNFEGAQQLLRVYGDASAVTFDGCDFQWYCTDVARPPLRFYGSVGRISFKGDCTFGPAVNSPNEYPTNLFWVRDGGWDISTEHPLRVGSNILTFTVVDATGSTLPYGFGNIQVDAATTQFTGLNYGQYVKLQGVTSVKALQLGRSPLGLESAIEILTGVGAPGTGIGQVGSLYLRQDPVDANTVIYICTANSSGTRTWVAK